MKPKLIIITALVTSMGCNFTARKIMGVHQPRIETDKSIAAFVKKAGAVSGEIFHIDSSASYYFFKDTTKLDRIPDIEIYSGKGELLRRLGKEECSNIMANSLSLIDFPAMQPVIINPAKLDDMLKDFSSTDNRKFTAADFNDDEYIVCITFMLAMGKVSSGNMEDWTSQLMQNKSHDKIRILYLNMDMHESWGIKNKKDDRFLKFEFNRAG